MKSYSLPLPQDQPPQNIPLLCVRTSELSMCPPGSILFTGFDRSYCEGCNGVAGKYIGCQVPGSIPDPNNFFFLGVFSSAFSPRVSSLLPLPP